MIKGNFIGTYSNELHAWNEIYISEEGRWINVDSTFGSTLGRTSLTTAIFSRIIRNLKNIKHTSI